jgi:hypothetical protein
MFCALIYALQSVNARLEMKEFGLGSVQDDCKSIPQAVTAQEAVLFK